MITTRTTIFKDVDPQAIRLGVLRWAQQHREFVLLDSHDFPQQHSSFDLALAADAFTSIATDADHAFADLEEYRVATADWIFGYLSYDLKNDVEALSSENADYLHFPELFFFQPKKLFFLRGDVLEMSYLRMCDDEMEQDFADISHASAADPTSAERNKPEIHQRIDRSTYLDKVGNMLEHIRRGDIYEANFCMEFYAGNADIDPTDVYQRLMDISRPPFGCFLKVKDHYAICASPERFLRKVGDHVISQPIKGTAPRFADPEQDAASATALAADEKERSENIMITDLVRNDLSKHAAKGSVKVDELCGVYSFKQVHHLVTTISATMLPVAPTQIIRDAFPMGSMTGAPKISAMEIIEKLEETRRGLYSGAIGYFSPVGDFDFNVVIRSILYNASTRYLSFSAGSAITAQSIPDKEYDECLLKARAMKEVLGATH